MNQEHLALPNISMEDALSAMKPYQRDLMKQLVDAHGEQAATELWLTSNGPTGVEKFGGSPLPPNQILERFLLEFRLFICGDPKYENARKEVSKLAKNQIKDMITIISATIAFTVGVASALVLPAVSILLHVVTSIGINIWCDHPRN
ncbi:hypothetical protein [Pseudomonas viridiflava]|uniref:hypothetical protein n=1 Tax=Pseudomonas viridiflava TaxID=33069 RepID=UPI000F042A02|nr:hypothetical protein [Pseudomonas viridiflava]